MSSVLSPQSSILNLLWGQPSQLLTCEVFLKESNCFGFLRCILIFDRLYSLKTLHFCWRTIFWIHLLVMSHFWTMTTTRGKWYYRSDIVPFILALFGNYHNIKAILWYFLRYCLSNSPVTLVEVWTLPLTFFVLFHIVCIRYIFIRIQFDNFHFHRFLLRRCLTSLFKHLDLCISNQSKFRRHQKWYKFDQKLHLKKIAQLRTHASRVHFAKIHLG